MAKQDKKSILKTQFMIFDHELVCVLNQHAKPISTGISEQLTKQEVWKTDCSRTLLGQCKKAAAQETSVTAFGESWTERHTSVRINKTFSEAKRNTCT